MSLLKRRLIWLSEAWPFFIIIIVIVITANFATWEQPPKSMQFNKFFGAALQGAGAVLVLISINENFGVFRGHNVFFELRKYILAFPMRQRSIELSGSACAQANGSGDLSTLPIWPQDTESQISFLRTKIGEIENNLLKHRGEIFSRVNQIQIEFKEKIDENETYFRDLEKKVQDTAIGGIKLQIFGIGLAVIGTVLSIYS